LLPSGDRLAWAELTTWETLTQLYGGLASLETIEQTLQSAVKELERLPVTWRRCAALARAHNNLGYLYRMQGRHGGAIGAYAAAIPLWRAVKIEAEHANTLNNLAFARAEVGDFGTGRRQAEDALELRQKAGARLQIGLSLNTLAHIAIRSELYITARYHAGRALELLKAAQDARGCGLALTALAEAKRRFASEGPCPDEEADQLLEEAVAHAQEATDILELIKEPSRQVEALIELGCAYRDRMKLWRRYRKEGVEELAQKGVTALQRAGKLAADQGITYRQADALINEAWLHYYLEGYYKFVVERPDKAKEEVKEIDRCLRDVPGHEQRPGMIPPQYFITKHGVPELDRERLIVPMLAQLGKAHLLWGQVAFNRFTDGETGALPKAIEYYTLSLAYDDMVSPAQFRDKRRGKDRIYERLKKLNPDEWQTVYKAVNDTEETYRLGRSEMRRFLEDNFGPPESFRPIKLL
jgi:tetratricopeptide (TPR) repeat protein